MEWISVKDKPITDSNFIVRVIVHKENGVVTEAIYHGKDKKFYKSLSNLSDLSFPATHWMLLPEPPKD